MNTSSILRHINAVRCLKLLRSGRSISRAEIARELKLTRSTVGNAVKVLLDEGLVSEIEETEGEETEGEGRKGRPGVRISLNPAGVFSMGIDVGTRVITCVLIDLRMEIVDQQTIPTGLNFRDPNVVFKKIIDLPRRALARAGVAASKVQGLCVSIPDLVAHDGRVVNAPFLEWRDYPLRQKLVGRFDPEWSIAVRNDAVCFAGAECAASTNSETENLLVLLLAEGVGSALVTGGKVIEGADGFAGEVGHTRVWANGRTASFEEPAGVAAFREFLARDQPVSQGVAELLARKDDPAVANALRAWGRSLAAGLANIIHTIDPGRIVLGGALANLYPLVSRQVIGQLQKELLEGFPPPHVSVTRFAGEGAALGAAALVRETVFTLPELEPDQ